MLSPYVDYTIGSPQYTWLLNDLQAIDRTITPFVRTLTPSVPRPPCLHQTPSFEITLSGVKGHRLNPDAVRGALALTPHVQKELEHVPHAQTLKINPN